MKYMIRVSTFIEVDTDHPEFDQSQSQEEVLRIFEEEMGDLKGEEDGRGMTVTSVQVELVE